MKIISDDDLFQIGIITTTHGIKGEVKVYPTTDDVNRFKKLSKVIIRTDRESFDLEISQVKFFKQMVILKFKEYNSINDVEGLKNASIMVTRKDAVDLDENEFFISDLIGLRAVSSDGIYKGEITDVLSGNANDVYEVTLVDQRKVLLPAIKECINRIDLQNGTVDFTMLDGLL